MVTPLSLCSSSTSPRYSPQDPPSYSAVKANLRIPIPPLAAQPSFRLKDESYLTPPCTPADLPPPLAMSNSKNYRSSGSSSGNYYSVPMEISHPYGI
jgi:hypothetical protein